MRQLTKSIRRIRNRVIIFILALGLMLYVASSRQMTDLERVLNSGILTMLTTPGPTTFFQDGRGKNGLDYIIANAFAESIGVTLVVRTTTSLRGMLLSVGGPQGDFAAANLVTTKDRFENFNFSKPYLDITQQLIYRRGTEKPKTLLDLNGDLLVIASSSHSENLQEIKKIMPSLQWREQDEIEMNDLIRMVHDGDLDYAIVDSLAYLVSRHIYPNAGMAFEVSDAQPVSWAFSKHGDGTLIKAANEFLVSYIAKGNVSSLKSQLLSQSKNFSVADSKRLGQLVRQRLPKYESAFRLASEQNKLDWHLIAAVSYQESHWNPSAKSPTGVRGLMMLTLDTAKEMGVNNRLDPIQSINGGAAYLAKIKKKLPSRITEPDRTLLALASYNVGFGHLEDARILTQRAGKNADLWSDVRAHLPLLSQPEYYSTVKYGYARGAEPVIYVDNIQYYQHYLRLLSVTADDQNDANSAVDEARVKWKSKSLPSI